MPSIEKQDVTVLLPTYNEATTVGSVIENFRAEGFDTILIIDGGSTDGTREIARDMDVEVRVQSDSGKGQAFREALEYVDTRYLLMADADGTYHAEDADKMLAPLANDADHVIGARQYTPGVEMKRLNHLGNRAMNRLFRTFHGPDYTDILSGYRAFDMDAIDKFYLTTKHFGIETEIAVEAARHNVTTSVVPVAYDERPVGSNSNLHPLWDGGSIVSSIYRLTIRSNPVLFFGVFALLSWLLSAGIAGYVGYEWVVSKVGHEALAIVSAFFGLFGTLILIFGVLVGQMNRISAEIRQHQDP